MSDKSKQPKKKEKEVYLLRILNNNLYIHLNFINKYNRVKVKAADTPC